jgi:thymidylate synthase
MLSLLLKSNMYKNRDTRSNYHEEYQYLNLIKDVIDHGEEELGRNGKTKMIFGTVMEFSLADNTIPILTSKKVAHKTCLKELLWFISGSTDNKVLQDKGVTIWNGNGSRDFLDSIGLVNYSENDLGPIYGFQWRHFNGDYKDCHCDYNGSGIDQLEYIINSLKDPLKRSSRRLIISAWNPCQLDKMVLPPCHVLMQFNVRRGKYLSCSLYQRSGDIGLGVPFNIASYSFLTHLLAHHCDLIAEKFVYNLGNAHIYDDHLVHLEGQLDNVPYNFPKVKIINKYNNIEDYKIEDFVVENYISHNKIKMDMRK